MEKFNIITNQYIEVSIDNEKGCYINQNGEELVRIETWGKSGKKPHINGYYIKNNKEMPVYGMGGSTGMGWGGSILGYATLEESKNL